MSTRFRSALTLFACAASLCESGSRALADSPTLAKPAQRVSTFRAATLFDAQQISLRVLPNGVRSIAKQTRGTSAIAIQVWVRAGSRYQSAQQSGAAHLVGVAALGGSREYSRLGGGIERKLSALSSSVQAQTARDATNFAVAVAPAFAGDAVRALADATLRPDLSDAALAAAKTKALNDIALRQTDPISVTSDLAYETAFARHPYSLSALGDQTDLQGLSPQNARDFHRARYRGAHISVVVVGDIPTERAHALVAQFFGSAPRVVSPDATVANSTFTPRALTRFTAATRSTTSLSFRAPGLTTPNDVVAMDVLLSYWSEGRDARMRRLLLGTSTRSAENADATSSTRAPALGLDIAFLTQRDPSLLSFTFVTEPDSTPTAVKTLLDEIARVRTQNIAPDELSRAKTLLSRQYIAQSETVSGQAGALGFYDAIGSYNFAVEYLERIARVAPSDLRRVASRYLAADKTVRISVEPSLSLDFPPGEPPRDNEGIGEGVGEGESNA